MAEGLEWEAWAFPEHVTLDPGSVPSELLDKLFVLQVPSE